MHQAVRIPILGRDEWLTAARSSAQTGPVPQPEQTAQLPRLSRLRASMSAVGYRWPQPGMYFRHQPTWCRSR